MSTAACPTALGSLLLEPARCQMTVATIIRSIKKADAGYEWCGLGLSSVSKPYQHGSGGRPRTSFSIAYGLRLVAARSLATGEACACCKSQNLRRTFAQH